MAATFDPGLSTDKDWVRHLIGDTNVDAAALQDETIAAILTEVIALGASAEGAKYCAAARAGEALIAGRSGASGAVIEKQVSKLRIKYSEGQALGAYRSYLDTLKATCTRLSVRPPGVLRAW